MEIEEAIVEFGTHAVVCYRDMCMAMDDTVPELFLGRFIAPRLSRRLGCRVSFEHQYEILAHQIGAQKTSELQSEIGQLRADLVVDQHPPAIIEFKIFGESGNISSILADRSKIEKLRWLGDVRGFLGIMICEKTTICLPSRIKTIEESLRRKINKGSDQYTLDGKWKWCFGCIALQD
jgi:hypothetical protein